MQEPPEKQKRKGMTDLEGHAMYRRTILARVVARGVVDKQRTQFGQTKINTSKPVKTCARRFYRDVPVTFVIHDLSLCSTGFILALLNMVHNRIVYPGSQPIPGLEIAFIPSCFV